jgi:anti-sigma B factor antagonist
MTEVSLRVREEPGLRLVELTGEVDSTTATGLYERLEPLVAAPGRLRLDLSGVSYISSAGLRVLVLVHRRAQQTRAGVELTGLSEELRFIMAATGFLDLFADAPEPVPEPNREAV